MKRQAELQFELHPEKSKPQDHQDFFLFQGFKFSPLSDLSVFPPELLKLIFNFLSNKRLPQLLICGCVSSFWKNVSDEILLESCQPKMKRYLPTLKKLNNLSPIETLFFYHEDYSLIQVFTNLKDLEVLSPNNMDPSLLEPLVLLESLNFPKFIPVHILSKLTNLKKFTIDTRRWFGQREYEDEDLMTLTGLTDLKLVQVHTLSDCWFSTLKNLTSLSVNETPKVSEISFNQYKKLEKLSLVFTIYTGNLFDLPRPEKLRSLSCSLGRDIIGKLIGRKELKSFTNLEKLSGQLELTEFTESLTQLEKLKIERGSIISDEGLRGLENLWRLEMKGRYFNVSVKELEKLTGLEVLIVKSGCWDEEDFETFTHLECLQIDKRTDYDTDSLSR